MIVFISGLSGTGKSSLVKYFEQRPLAKWEFFDFDKGIEPVPEDRSKHFDWRKSQTDYWLSIAAHNADGGINTTILGLCLYPRDIAEVAKTRNIDVGIIHCAYLSCSPEERKRRLSSEETKHRWRERSPWHDDFFAVMKNECEKEFNTTGTSIEKVAGEVIEWLKSLSSKQKRFHE